MEYKFKITTNLTFWCSLGVWYQEKSTMADSGSEIHDESEKNYAVSNTDPKNMLELTNYVQALLQNMQDKFQTMSDQIITRIDEMGNRIDDLEKNIADLMTQSGVDGSEK